MAALCRASSLSCTSSSTCTLGSRSSLQLADLPALPRAAGCVRPSLARRAAARCPTCKGRRALAVRVSAQKDGLAAFRDDVAKFIGRYDPVTTGLGSLVVCGYCMIMHGQSVEEALEISAFATVLGMVANEVLFLSGDESQA